MKIRCIRIAGYGRFTDAHLDFVPGLQVIMGPNEKGKSTIRSFIADMLYGQKCNETQRIYEESNALRAPWNGSGAYGGSLVYELDNGQTFEVLRNFDKNQESIQIIDRDSGLDITQSFTRYRNRELDFARRHLGLAKEVFLSTATITHMSLTDLGDSEALDRIRESMLALADSGGATGSVDTALDNLARRISAIGRPDNKNRPLPVARQRIAALETELAEARALQASLRALAVARMAVNTAAGEMQREKREAEATLRAQEYYEDAARLEEAESLQAELDTLAREAEKLAGGRDFMLDLDSEVQARHRSLEAAEKQLEKLRNQCDAVRLRLESEQAVNRPATPVTGDFPAGLEERLNDALAARSQLAERVLEAHTLVNAAKDRMREVQAQLAEMPDFSRLAADPVEWLSQLASSFAVALRARDEECALRDALRKEVEALEDANTPYDGLFASCSDFSTRAREYEIQSRVIEEQQKRQASELHSLQVTFVEAQGETQAFLPIGIACIVVAAVLGGMYFFLLNSAMGFPAIVAFVMGLVFIGMRSERKGRLARLRESIGLAETELAKLSHLKTDESLEVIADLLKTSGLETVRELEALHDQYRSTLMELRIRSEALRNQEEKAAEAEERIPQLLARFKDTFARAGEVVETEKDVQDAAGRAVARYQAYREAKRRATSNRSVLERHMAELVRLEALAEKNNAELAAIEQEVRRFVEDCGFLDAARFNTARELIGAFRQSLSEGRERHGRHSLLAENLRNLEVQLESEEKETAAAREVLDALFRQHGVHAIEEWNGRAAAARELRSLERQTRVFEERLASLLGKHSMLALRERVARFGKPAGKPQESRETTQQRIDRLGDAIERKIQEEHALHLQLTEQSVRSRAIPEIEEEIALLTDNIRELENEVEAASYAMALIEDVARDKHAEIAPHLAQRASAYLAAITGGNYSELHLGRDLAVGVRVPQIDRVNDAPEKSLSKGTVDQIYLALRLAFVQCASEGTESIPMLLDDPFANYDDVRLESTLDLISSLVGPGQILLFTCREDVVAAAEQRNTPIIRL